MTGESTGADSLDERVRRLLADAEERLDGVERDGEGGEGADGHLDEEAMEELSDVAARADDLVSETDPADLLDAVGSSDGHDGDDPESILEAIEESDPETVVVLRKLLTLSKMDGDEDEDSLVERVEEFHDLEEAHPDATGGDDPEERAEAGGSADEPDDEARAESPDTDGDETGEKTADDYAEEMRSSIQEGIDEFKDGIQRLQDELEDDGEDDDEEESDSEAGDGGTGHSPANSGTMFSTVPSRSRTALRGVRRLSTVRNNRTDDE